VYAAAPHLLAPALGPEIERFELRPRFLGEGAVHIVVDEVDLRGAQSPRQLIVGDAQLVELFGVRIRQEPQQVADEPLVVAPRLG
jgi:hypothetical protein